MSVSRTLRALARLRSPRRDALPPVPRLTLPLPVVDPPREPLAPMGDPIGERSVEIPLYVEP